MLVIKVSIKKNKKILLFLTRGKKEKESRDDILKKQNDRVSMIECQRYNSQVYQIIIGDKIIGAQKLIIGDQMIGEINLSGDQ